MKRTILLILSILLLAINAYADAFVVASYKHDPTNLAARVHQRKDNNDETCGLILVRTSILNLGVVANTGVVGSINFKEGDYWVYVSPGTRRISFYKEGFVRMDYDLPAPVKSGETYLLNLRYRVTDNSSSATKMGFVVINSQPKGADVYINDSATGMQTLFQNPYQEGYYRFQLKKPFYDDYSGSFDISRGKTTRVKIKLVPNYGSLKLKFTPSTGVSLNVDGDISTQISPYFIEKLKPGEHTLVLNKATYDTYRQKFIIKKGQTTALNMSMVPDFGGFTVNTVPEINAKVNVDGVDYKGTTPLTVAKLAPGKHTLRLTKNMYKPWQGSFTITKGKSTKKLVTMKANFGTININAQIGDTIFIDNQQARIGSYYGRLLRGEHIIRVGHKNYYTQSKQIEMIPGANLQETFNLVPKTGTLSVMTYPINANILINEKPVGQSPKFIDSLMVGTYNVQLKKQGYASVDKKIEIIENQTTSIKETLKRGMDVQVTSLPSGTQLYLDGKYEGTTPLSLTVDFSEHSFKLVNGEQTLKKNILFSEKSPSKLNFQMNQFVNYTETTRNLDIEMVAVKGGAFQMGSNNGDDDDKPVHTVTLSNFYIGKYEVTQKQWEAIMGSNPSNFIGDNLPVENVSWNDVQKFIRKLNQITGKHYRLPTEAEWEYAARGGNKSSGYKYSGSNNIDEVAWYSNNSNDQTHPVGQKKPNELGIYDMSGNVWEWCNDWFGKRYYRHSTEPNPPGPSIGEYRVLRGGSWYSSEAVCRVAFRNGKNRIFSSYVVGFRIAR